MSFSFLPGMKDILFFVVALQALRQVGIKTRPLDNNLYLSIQELRKALDMCPQELAAFLVYEEPSLSDDIDSARTAIQKWQGQGKIRPEILQRAKFRNLVEEFCFAVFKNSTKRTNSLH